MIVTLLWGNTKSNINIYLPPQGSWSCCIYVVCRILQIHIEIIKVFNSDWVTTSKQNSLYLLVIMKTLALILGKHINCIFNKSNHRNVLIQKWRICFTLAYSLFIVTQMKCQLLIYRNRINICNTHYMPFLMVNARRSIIIFDVFLQLHP